MATPLAVYPHSCTTCMLEPCAGQAPPQTKSWAPPPIFNGQRPIAAADNISACRRCHGGAFNCFLPFLCFAWFRYKCLPRCEIEIYTSLTTRQFVPMSGLKNSISEESLLYFYF